MTNLTGESGGLVDAEGLLNIADFLSSTNCSVDPNSTHLFNNETGECVPTDVFFTKTPWWISLIVQVLYGIVCCVGLCGNTLVIYVVVRFSKMQTVTNLYIVNLAIADECFLVGIPFLMTTLAFQSWPFGKIVCKAYFTSTSINQITSSMFLLIMSADRYLAVCHPISAPKWRTPLIAKFVALTAWTLSALIMVPIYMYANTLEQNHNRVNCNIFWPNSGAWTGESIFIVYSFIISFAVPLTLIMIFYVLVILKLRTLGPKRRPPLPASSSALGASNNALNSDQKNTSTDPAAAAATNHLTPQQVSRAKDRRRSHRKVTKLVLTVITVYFLCWAPYWATQMALIFMPPEGNHSGAMLTLFLLAGCLSYSNSTMNPILYAFLSDNFKKSFLKACTCAKGQDVNAQLHVENSLFPRGKKSDRQRKGVVATSGTSGITGQGNNTGSAAAIATNIPGSNNLLQVPSSAYDNRSQVSNNSYPVDDEDETDSEDDEGAAILSSGSSKAVVSPPGPTKIVPMPSTSNASNLLTAADAADPAQQNTFIQDGVHVTSL